MGPRLRVIVDNSRAHAGGGSAESKAAKRLAASAGKAHVKRMHFRNLQHNKALIAKRNGKAFKVLAGSTNFSFRGIYVQANNVLVFHAPEITGLFEQAFEVAFRTPARFDRDPISSRWHLVQLPGKPAVYLSLSPHNNFELALNPLVGAIDQATSSVLFCIAFLYSEQASATRDAIERLMKKNIFSYGVSDKLGHLRVRKPDGSLGLVGFAHLANNAPEPFKSEWSGGAGIHEHHKFVITDFSLPTAKVFTGSSNLSPSGEKGNGDHLIMIQDSKVATAYAIEALRVFDHLHFRATMQRAKDTKKHPTTQHPLVLHRPPAISGQPPWFADSYREGSQQMHDRELFSH